MANEIASAGTTAAPADTSKTTIFVRNLPFNATNEDLESFFSEIGPLRSCFVVASKSSGDQADKQSASNNKGYGFVHFATAEDAKQALEVLKDQKFMGKRKLSMELAKRRLRKSKKDDGDSDDDGHDLMDTEPSRVPAQPTKKFVKCAIPFRQLLLIDGIPQDGCTKKHLFKKVKKYGSVKQVIYPVYVPFKMESINKEESSEGGQDIIYPSRANVLIHHPSQMENFQKHLDDHVFKGSKLRVTAMPDPRVAKATCRLIIRNLSFKTAEIDLLNAVKEFGIVVEINLPRKDDGGLRGFAFITFATKEQAEAAMGMNGKKIAGRVVAVDWALSKSNYEESAKDAQDENDVDVTETDEKEKSRTVSDGDVDVEEVVDEASEDNEEIEQDIENEDEDDNIKVIMEDESEPEDEDADDDANSDVEMESDDEEPREKVLSEDAEDGATLFIRNLAFETEEDDLEERFGQYGPLKYAKITRDKETGVSRGTGFIKFVNNEDAEKVLEEFELTAPNQDSFKYLNLQPETSSGFWLHGRQLFIMPALTRNSAQQVAENKKEKEDNDKRNMYLLKEGYIRSGTHAAEELSKVEIEKREASYKARKRQLEKFPHLFLSKTRLCIRNLPKKVDEKQLKQITKEMAVEWLKEAKNLAQNGKLGRSEKLEYEKLVKDQAGIHDRVFVKQAVIVRDKNKVNPAVVKESEGDKEKKVHGQSLGYGFVEFSHHAHALGCLRRLNNNPDVLDGRRLIVEFAIENQKILKKREQNRERQKRTHENADIEKTTGKPVPKKATREIRMDNLPPIKREQKNERKKPEKDCRNNGRAGQSSINKNQRTPGQPNNKKAHNEPVSKPATEPTEKADKKKNKRKVREDQNDDAFQSLVDRYRKRLATDDSPSEPEKKRRWYEA